MGDEIARSLLGERGDVDRGKEKGERRKWKEKGERRSGKGERG